VNSSSVDSIGRFVSGLRPPTEAASLFADAANRRATNSGSSMSAWLIIALVSIASMPVAYDMARGRGRSTRSWLETAMTFGPLALLALLILGKRRARKTTSN
jgi:hypothetical protein